MKEHEQRWEASGTSPPVKRHENEEFLNLIAEALFRYDMEMKKESEANEKTEPK